jgi:hypothetical protein
MKNSAPLVGSCQSYIIQVQQIDIGSEMVYRPPYAENVVS